MANDVLDVTAHEAKLLRRKGVAQDAANAQAGQGTLEPIMGARDNQLAAAEEKCGAVGRTQTDGDRCKSLTTIEGKGKYPRQGGQIDQGVRFHHGSGYDVVYSRNGTVVARIPR